jgi:tetratricopeptide (TPR) repeat protein
MRDRRWRRLVDADKGQQRGASDTTGDGLGNWLRTHLVASFSIISVAIVGVGTGWVTGFFDSILDSVAPSGVDAACALRETVKYHWPFENPSTTSERFTILIATIDHDDADHTYTRAVARAFLKQDGIDRIDTCRVLRLSGVGRDAEITTVATARKWLKRRHADLLIGGELLKKDEAVSLWFVDKDPAHDWRPSTFRLDANLLKEDFSDAAATQLLGVALSAIRPVTQDNGRYLVDILKPVAERLRHLLQPPTKFAVTQLGELEYALGLALFVIGEQGGDNSALADATKAFRAALAESTRDRAPLQWAAIQETLGNALRVLGEREEDTANLKESVAAFHTALEEYRRDRVPLLWAGGQMNLGTALEALGERENDTAHLQAAVTALRAPLAEWTRDRVPLGWAMALNNLGNALQALGERESGTTHLKEAIKTLRAALEVRTRDRVPLDWATTQNNLGNALERLGERESGTAHLTEAVAAYHAALEGYGRDQVPLLWAAAQNNLGSALSILAQRERGTAHLQEAVTAFRMALEVRTRDQVPLDWAATQNNLGVALSMLGSRGNGVADLEEAVKTFRAALEVRTRDRIPSIGQQRKSTLAPRFWRSGCWKARRRIWRRRSRPIVRRLRDTIAIRYRSTGRRRRTISAWRF